MAIVGTGEVAWNTMRAASNAARDAYMAGKDVLTQSQITELVDAMRAAEMNAMFLHLTANVQVVVVSVAGVTTGPGVSGPGIGTIL